jgi:hypothetical protein
MIPFDLQAEDLHARERDIGAKLAAAVAEASIRRVVLLNGLSADLKTGGDLLRNQPAHSIGAEAPRASEGRMYVCNPPLSGRERERVFANWGHPCMSTGGVAHATQRRRWSSRRHGSMAAGARRTGFTWPRLLLHPGGARRGRGSFVRACTHQLTVIPPGVSYFFADRWSAQADFSDADLRSVSLAGVHAYGQGTKFDRARLDSASFTSAYLMQAASCKRA